MGRPEAVPEMGFTLGGIDELEDDEVLCCLAVDAEGQVQGVTSWLPVYADGPPGELDAGLHAPARGRFPRRDGVPDRLRGAGAPEHGGGDLAVRLAAGEGLLTRWRMRPGDVAGTADGGGGRPRRWPESWTSWASARARLRLPFAGNIQVPFQTRLPDAVPLLPGPAAAARHGQGAEPRLSARIVRAAKCTAAADPGALIHAWPFPPGRL